ncbi:uncharacterized protein DNG_01452 [Cephalotrichum gorgonifer]|uniref:CoA-binding domain-containing protein n=1 Tax=Cephalotrichum gorgonifer TaxID=2041049 RepID=A0AAE8MSM2_9PEZI|nr:uncharacterized protein DNG_01452 [Cephalotrichum gorgonifer]
MSEAAARTFFSSPAFAVVGASSNPAKFGNIIFKWYHAHSLPVTPINPTAATITLPSNPTPFPALPSISRLPNPTETSISIVTPPAATLAVLREAKWLGVPAVWLQPGTFDDEVLRFLTEEGGFKAAVAGEGGDGSEGWCVLVDGEKALRGVGKL